MVQCKIDNWQIKLNKKECKVCVYKNSQEVKRINSKLFAERGMKMFPQELYNKICKELKSANVYDRFLDKFYDWREDDS